MTKTKKAVVTTKEDTAWLDKLNAKFKNTRVYKYGDGGLDLSWERFSTGSLSLDIATGGGWVYGGMNYIAGWESTGKTTLMLHAIRSIQQDGHRAMFVDFENAFDASYARSLGVDVDNLFVTQPESMEDGLELIREVSKNFKENNIKGIILDSVAAGIMFSELEEDLSKAGVAGKARLSSKALPQIAMYCREHGIAFMVTNQKREKIGVMYGNPETENGGKAWQFYQTIKVELRRKIGNDDVQKDEFGTPLSNPVVAKVQKNKTAAPFKVAQYEIVYGKGIDQKGEMVDIAIDNDWVKRGGAWFTLFDPETGEEIGKVQGKPKLRELLEYNPETYDTMFRLVMESFNY